MDKERREDISNYFETRHKKDEGYHIKQDEILLVIKKNIGA